MGPSDMLDTVNTMMNKARSLHPSCLHLVMKTDKQKGPFLGGFYQILMQSQQTQILAVGCAGTSVYLESSSGGSNVQP